MTKRRHILSFVLLACALPAAADTVRYSYDNAGRLTKVEYGSGQTITYDYDPAGNLLARTVTAPASASRKRTKDRATESPNSQVKTRQTRQRGQ